jgi:hypothetical protein
MKLPTIRVVGNCPTSTKARGPVMLRKEMLTDEEQFNLKQALEHIEELERLMKMRPVETFKALINLNVPIKLEIEMKGATYAVKLNHSD